jgi:hypothetical protein
MPWELTGNRGTNPAANFLGTTDNQPLIIRPNGGTIGIGTTNPAAGLHVSGNARNGIILVELPDDEAGKPDNNGMSEELVESLRDTIRRQDETIDQLQEQLQSKDGQLESKDRQIE